MRGKHVTSDSIFSSPMDLMTPSTAILYPSNSEERPKPSPVLISDTEVCNDVSAIHHGVDSTSCTGQTQNQTDFVRLCIRLVKHVLEVISIRGNDHDYATSETVGSPVHTGQKRRLDELEERKNVVIRLCDELTALENDAVLSRKHPVAHRDFEEFHSPMRTRQKHGDHEERNDVFSHRSDELMNEIRMKVKDMLWFSGYNNANNVESPDIQSVDTGDGDKNEGLKNRILRACDEIIEAGNSIMPFTEASAVGEGFQSVKSADCTDKVKRQRIELIKSVATTAQQGKILIQSIPIMATF